MPNIVSVRKLLDGPRYAIFSVYFRSDGSGSEIVKQAIVDPSVDFSPRLDGKQRLSLHKVWFGLAGADVSLSFDNPSNPDNLPFWVLPAGTTSTHVNFNEFGGISDKTGIDASGKLVFSTRGLVTIADQGSLIVKVSKHVDLFSNP